MPISIQRGSLLIYRVFDIAEEVDLSHASSILSKQSGESRMRLTRPGRQSVIIRNAPITAHLGEVEIKIADLSVRAEINLKLWDYGALSLCFQIPLPVDTTWEKLIQISSIVTSDSFSESQIDTAARKQATELSRVLKPATKKINSWDVFEDYVIYFLEEITGAKTGQELLDRVDVSAVILGEALDSLAAKTKNAVLDYTHQYASNDLVVIDWNSAVILEPSGSRDIPDVLEFALTHLLEVRYYDDLLDERLITLYDAIEVRRQSVWRSDYASIAKEANTRFIEVSEFMERVENSLKVVGDFYLAVIFRSAARRFRIADWQQSITRKMNLLARVAELLQDELNAHRSLLLELVVIFLIAFEILSAILKGSH